MMGLPTKTPENSPVPHVRKLQRAVNQLIDAIRAREVQNSPNTRVERLAGGGITIHTKGSSTVVSTDDTWY